MALTRSRKPKETTEVKKIEVVDEKLLSFKKHLENVLEKFDYSRIDLYNIGNIASYLELLDENNFEKMEDDTQYGSRVYNFAHDNFLNNNDDTYYLKFEIKVDINDDFTFDLSAELFSSNNISKEQFINFISEDNSSDIETLKSILDDKNSELESLREKLSEIETEIDDLESEINGLESEIDDLEDGNSNDNPEEVDFSDFNL